jgi:LAO/AO transport system kinase
MDSPSHIAGPEAHHVLPAGITSLQQLVDGVCSGHRAMLGRAITLVESSAPRHRETADALLQALMPHAGKSMRVGISGVPGVGKSTFIEAFGIHLTSQGHRVAVLAVDPSSTVSGGSILGDKTRMNRLALDDHAFIRPSPSAGTLGGVARKTRETMLVCEAAGFDVVIVETVGVGQSETTVAQMVDMYLVLMLAGAGDELQGIKKGILEIADLLAINKADGDNRIAAQRARREFEHALHYTHRPEGPWMPRVMTCSAVENVGIDAIWDAMLEFRTAVTGSGHWQSRRQQQQVDWMWATVRDELERRFLANPATRNELDSLLPALRAGTLSAGAAARRLLRMGQDFEP